jgi:hypothetical protein
MADGNLTQLSHIFTDDGFDSVSGLNISRLAQDENPVEALLDSDQYSFAMSDLVKKIHRVTSIPCHSEMHASFMRVFDHYLQSK